MKEKCCHSESMVTQLDAIEGGMLIDDYALQANLLKIRKELQNYNEK
jgi:hypothetical protein